MEIKKSSIKKNYIMNMLLTMSSFIFPLITFPYVSRVLLPSGTGKVAFATSLVSYFNIFAQLGIPTYGIRACAKVRDDRQKLTQTAQELLLINIFMNIISYTVLIFVVFQNSKLYSDKNLIFVISCTIFLTSIGMEWIYKALEQYTYITVRSLIAKIIALVFMFFFVKTKHDYVIYGGITILASSASNIFNFINIHRFIDLKLQSSYNFKQHLKPVFVFFAMSCATTIYTHLDTLMLGFIANEQEVGYYNAAVKIKTILVSIVTSLGTVLLPRVSYYVEHDMLVEFWKICKKSLNFIFIISIPLTIYFILFAKNGIIFLSGEAFMGSILPMKIIMSTLILIGLTNLLGIQILVPLGKEKYVLISVVTGAITNLIINYLLIPYYHSVGAAIGTLVAEFVVFVVQCFILKDKFKLLFSNISYYKILIASFFGMILSKFILFINLNGFYFLALTSIIFFGTYVGCLIIMKEKLVLELINDFKAKIRR